MPCSVTGDRLQGQVTIGIMSEEGGGGAPEKGLGRRGWKGPSPPKRGQKIKGCPTRRDCEVKLKYVGLGLCLFGMWRSPAWEQGGNAFGCGLPHGPGRVAFGGVFAEAGEGGGFAEV